MDIKKTNDVFYEVIKERNRQDAKWGEQHHKPEIWLSIMTEEVGEMAEAINETIFDNGEEAIKKGGINNIKKELIQILAVGFAMYVDLENKKESKDDSSN